MAQVLINDTTLSALGDIIREVKGESKYKYYSINDVYENISNNSMFSDRDINQYSTAILIPYINTDSVNNIISSTLTITKMDNSAVGDLRFRMGQCHYSDYYNAYIADTNASIGAGFGHEETSVVISDNDYFWRQIKERAPAKDSGEIIFFVLDIANSNLKFELEITTNLLTEEINPDNHYTPAEIVEEITEITDNVVPYDILKITGDASYRFYGNNWNSLIEKFGNKIQTESLTSCQYMFCNSSELKNIPFELNIGSTNCYMSNVFDGCQQLKEAPKINNLKITTSSISGMFNSCWNIRNIPEDYFDTWDTSNIGLISLGRMFQDCFSLRKIPQFILDNFTTTSTSASSQLQYSLAYCCFVLDEIKNLNLNSSTTITSNSFNITVNNANRLKSFTFATDNGVPKTAKWKAQTFDFSTYVGYVASVSYITDYNSGITTETRITDDTSYQALKDNPDSWTTNIAYSRYNHDSAVETINSLPDTSAYLATAGGTNTIKFKRGSGSATDGGSCGDLTDAEIAVATAKGWTVTFVN